MGTVRNYEVRRCGSWWWGILDKTTGLLIKNESGKLILFKTKPLAQEYCTKLKQTD